MPSSKSPSELNWNEYRSEIVALRARAWSPKTGSPGATFEDEFDVTGLHYGILAGGALCAAIRLTIHTQIYEVPHAEIYSPFPANNFPTPVASYNRMVVAPESRGQRLSPLLDQVCIEQAEARGANCLVGATGSVKENQHRIASMTRLGFRSLGSGSWPVGSPISHDNPPTVMVLEL